MAKDLSLPGRKPFKPSDIFIRFRGTFHPSRIRKEWVLNPRILIIDDSIEVRNLLERVLSKYYPSVGVSTGEEALKLARGGDFRLAFLASRVLRKEGWLLLDSLKGLIPQGRIVIIADYPGDSFLSQLKDKDLYTCIHKPFTISEVLNLVKAATVQP